MSSWFFSPKPLQKQPTPPSPAQSLLHYETGSPPPSARVDPKLKLQPRRPLRLWDYWKVGIIVAAKGVLDVSLCFQIAQDLHSDRAHLGCSFTSHLGATS